MVDGHASLHLPKRTAKIFTAKVDISSPATNDKVNHSFKNSLIAAIILFFFLAMRSYALIDFTPESNL